MEPANDLGQEDRMQERTEPFVSHGNILAGLGASPAAEAVRPLLSIPGLRIERIVSLGQASPPGVWYDQPQGEWVLLYAGAARLRFEDEAEERILGSGDYLWIAPHRRHRVSWTTAEAPTVWLAIHVEAGREGG